MDRNGFKVRMAKSGDVEMEFYGMIGNGAYFLEDDYVSAPDVLRSLRDIGSIKTLTLLMNSPGGDVYDGFQIANRLDKLREEGTIKRIETVAEGMVASAATLPFLKGDRRIMRNGSRFMIHKPWTMGAGNADDLRHVAARMDQTEEEAIDLYEAASALTRTEIRAAMAAETYYTPDEATAIGFATESIEPFRIAACMSDDVRQRFHMRLPSDLDIMQPAHMRRQKYEEQLRLHPKNW